MTKDETAATVAAMIKAARERNGWTIYELAKRTGIHCGHLSRIEKGKIAIRIDILNRLALALNFTVAFPI